jgi:tRNA threonylcarbamoyl adenosine modification protein YeaZ
MTNHIKYSLGLHTTSPQLGLSISNFTGDTRSQVWDLGRDLSTHLHLYLAEFMQPQTWQDLAFIAVAKGPGSFTGTRIGVVTARTLAQQLNIPLFSISTLAAIARSAKEKYSPKDAIAVSMDARRGQVFVAIYQISEDNSDLQVLLPDSTMTRDIWQQTLDNLKTNYHLVDAPVNLGNTVNSILELAYLDWQKGNRPQWLEALPFYGQHPVNQ